MHYIELSFRSNVFKILIWFWIRFWFSKYFKILLIFRCWGVRLHGERGIPRKKNSFLGRTPRKRTICVWRHRGIELFCGKKPTKVRIKQIYNGTPRWAGTAESTFTSQSQNYTNLQWNSAVWAVTAESIFTLRSQNGKHSGKILL